MCLASEGLVCWRVMLGRQVLWGQVALVQLQNQACAQLEPLTCWVFCVCSSCLCHRVAQSDGEATCVHHAMHQTPRIEGKGQALSSVLVVEGQEVFLPTGLTLALDAFSDRALRRKVRLQKLPGTQLAPSIMQPPGRERGTCG